MGCTSSAPNMASHANGPDKIIQFSEQSKTQPSIVEVEVISTDDGKGQNDTKVLPSCDTLAEPVQLDRNNKSLLKPVAADMEKDSYTNGHIVDNTLNSKEDMQNEEKLSSLGEVVEKVVELYVADNLIENPQTETSHQETKEQVNSSKENIDTDPAKIPEETQTAVPENETEPTEQINAKLEEAISPSQSTSSRATRWEALADIAAELPPSLAVDPVTGQIYALSK